MGAIQVWCDSTYSGSGCRYCQVGTLSNIEFSAYFISEKHQTAFDSYVSGIKLLIFVGFAVFIWHEPRSDSGSFDNRNATRQWADHLPMWPYAPYFSDLPNLCFLNPVPPTSLSQNKAPPSSPSHTFSGSSVTALVRISSL